MYYVVTDVKRRRVKIKKGIHPSTFQASLATEDQSRIREGGVRENLQGLHQNIIRMVIRLSCMNHTGVVQPWTTQHKHISELQGF